LTFIDLVEFVVAVIDFLEEALDGCGFGVDNVALPCVGGDDNFVGLGGCLVEEDKDGLIVVVNFTLEEALTFVDLVDFIVAVIDFLEEAVDAFEFVVDDVALPCVEGDDKFVGVGGSWVEETRMDSELLLTSPWRRHCHL